MRAFIAIDICSEAREELKAAIRVLKTADVDVKWVEPGNIHLTIKFLGDIDDDKAGEVKVMLGGITAGKRPFEISLFKLGAFPRLELPKVIWVGVDRNCAMVEDIAKEIDTGCGKLGFPEEERPFTAHITVGRVRSSKNKEKLRQKLLSAVIKPISFPVTEIVMYKSDLTPNGPVYTRMHAAELLTDKQNV